MDSFTVAPRTTGHNNAPCLPFDATTAKRFSIKEAAMSVPFWTVSAYCPGFALIQEFCRLCLVPIFWLAGHSYRCSKRNRLRSHCVLLSWCLGRLPLLLTLNLKIGLGGYRCTHRWQDWYRTLRDTTWELSVPRTVLRTGPAPCGSFLFTGMPMRSIAAFKN